MSTRLVLRLTSVDINNWGEDMFTQASFPRGSQVHPDGVCERPDSARRTSRQSVSRRALCDGELLNVDVAPLIARKWRRTLPTFFPILNMPDPRVLGAATQRMRMLDLLDEQGSLTL